MAESYRLSKRLLNSEQRLEKLINIFQSNLPLEVKNNEIQKLTGTQESSLLSVQKKQIALLEGYWQAYKQPDVTREDAVSLLEKHKSLMSRAKFIKVNEIYLATGVKNAMVEDPAPYSSSARAIADLGGGVSKALNVSTGDYDQVVKYSGDLEYKKFKECVVRSPVTKKPEVFSSIKAILSKSQDRGLDRKQCAKILYLFIQEEFPDQLSSINLQTEQPGEIASAAFNLVRSYKSLEAIQRAIIQFRRPPDMSIHVAYSKLQGLYKELVKTRKPFNKEAEVMSEVNEYLKKTIKDFLSPTAAIALESFINQCYQHGEAVEGEEILDFVSEMENTNPEMAMIGDRALAQKSLSLVSFANNMVKQDIHTLEKSRESRRDGWQARSMEKKNESPKSTERVPTPRGGSGPSPGRKSGEPEKKKIISSANNRPRSRSQNGRSASGTRNRSQSNPGTTGNSKQCLICCIPSCPNRAVHIGACEHLPVVRYNPSNFCQICMMVGHFSTGDMCKVVSKKRANLILGN